MSSLVVDRRVVWDSRILKQVDEAKTTIMDFKRRGHEILKANGEPMQRFHPSLEEVIIKVEKIPSHVLKILTPNGDDRIVWDKDNGPEAMEAKDKFHELIKKGYKAFSVDQGGKRKRHIKEFDVEAEEILMIPETAKG